MTYPLTMPVAPGFSELVVLPESVTARSQSPFTYRGQTVVWPGKRLRFTATLPPMRRTRGQEWAAFFTALNGREGTFIFQPSKALMSSPQRPYLEITPPVGAVDSGGITTVDGLMSGTVGDTAWTESVAAGLSSTAVIAARTGRECEWTGTAVRVYGHNEKITVANLAWTVLWDGVAGTEAGNVWPKLSGQGDGGEILTDGWGPTLDAPPGTTVLAGEWVKINGRLHQIVESGNADVAGELTLKVWPHILAVPDNTDVIYGEPVTGIFRLDQDPPEHVWRTDLFLEGFTFTCIEDDA